MAKSRDNLKEGIKKYFCNNLPDYTPKFWIQGLYKMNTLITRKNRQTDIDTGIYFSSNPKDLSPFDLQRHVYDAVYGVTSQIPMHKNKCICVNYQDKYNIDFPIYFMPDGEIHPQLATKKNQWIIDDPKEMYEKFRDFKQSLEDRITNQGKQMVRVVRYLKFWADQKDLKDLSGIAITVLVMNSFVGCDHRDDTALFHTLVNIKNKLNSNFSCTMPVGPCDDLLKGCKTKNTIMDAVDAFVKDASTAINEARDEHEVSLLWRKHLGNEFPLGNCTNILNRVNKPALIAAIGASKPYSRFVKSFI